MKYPTETKKYGKLYLAIWVKMEEKFSRSGLLRVLDCFLVHGRGRLTLAQVHLSASLDSSE